MPHLTRQHRTARATVPLVAGLVLATAMVACRAGTALATDLAAARSSIQADDAKRHVAVLADDAFEGRRAGSRGGQAAGTYIVEQFRRIGIDPAGDEGGYYQRFGSMRNVLGMLRGSDPEASREVVVLGAHYDHVGYGSPADSYGPTGFIHNGADDNASGIAGLLEVAEACMKLPTRPRRTLVFACWDGEEIDLLGSRHFVRQRPPPLTHHTVVFSINLDMIGRLRDERLEVYGTRSVAGLRRRVVQANVPVGLQLDFSWEVSEDSDHYPFLAAGIPTVMFHTGLHDEYHRPSDDTHLVNFTGIEPVARLTLEMLLSVADAAERPQFREASRGETEATRRSLEAAALPAPPRRWGLGTREDVGDPSAPLVVRVSPQTPAERSGIKLGDRIVAIDDEPLDNQADMVAKLVTSQEGVAPTAVRLTVERHGQLITLTMREDKADD